MRLNSFFEPQLIPVLILPLIIGILILMFCRSGERAKFMGFLNLLLVISSAICFIQISSWPIIDTFNPYSHQYLSLSIISVIPAIIGVLFFSYIYRQALRNQWAQVFLMLEFLYWVIIVLVYGNFIVDLAKLYSLAFISFFPSAFAIISLAFVVKNFNLDKN